MAAERRNWEATVSHIEELEKLTSSRRPKNHASGPVLAVPPLLVHVSKSIRLDLLGFL